MNSRSQSALPWYRVPEAWLMVLLLGATVIGTFAMLATAIEHPDTHLLVPADVPRPSKIPPLTPATAASDTSAATAKDDG